MLTEEQARLIASLPNDPAYKALCEHLEEETAGLLNDLRYATSPQDVLRFTRLWQIAAALVDRLKNAPEIISEKLKEQAAQSSLELPIWGEEEDPFLRPKRPVPPTYMEAETGKIITEK